MMMRFPLSVAAVALVACPSSFAQQRRVTPDPIGETEAYPTAPLQPRPVFQPGRGAGLSAGRVGQRQMRDQAAPQVSVAPMGRIANRIQNRVQARLRNRIDRFYDPRANVTSPFSVASEQVRTARQPIRR